MPLFTPAPVARRFTAATLCLSCLCYGAAIAQPADTAAPDAPVQKLDPEAQKRAAEKIAPTQPVAPTTKSTAVTGGPSSKATAKDPFPAASPEHVVAVTAKIFPAVVRIDVAAETFFEG